jgi:hypothetical protein
MFTTYTSPSWRITNGNDGSRENAPSRSDEKAMRVPSGENAGRKSPPGWFVRLTARDTSCAESGVNGRR